MTDIEEFLRESNAIESEYSDVAFEDAKLAWDYLSQQTKLTVENVLETHRLLMQHLRPDIAGAFRDCDVFIGGQRKYFISQTLLKEDLQKIIDLIHQSIILSMLREGSCQHAHVFFEEVHPFEDGNGRIGRIIYNWHRKLLGLSVHIIHEGQEQKEYYRWFRR